MRCIWTATILVLAAAQVRADEPVTVASPDGKVAFSLATGQAGPAFSITVDGQTVLTESPLGLLPTEAPPLGPGLGIRNKQVSDTDENWTPVCGTVSPVRDEYRMLQVDLAEAGSNGRALTILVRAYNDGVAFRYRVAGGSGEYRLDGERTAFHFAEDAKAWALPLKGFRTSYEGKYKIGPLSSLGESLIGLPITLELSGGKWMAITEAHLEDYAGLYVASSPQSPKTLLTRLSTRGQGPAVVRNGSLETPWRVILLGRRAGDLIESQIVSNCNPPSAIADTAWIKPGKVTWDWWSKWMVSGVDFNGGINTATYLHYADFAAEAGFPYLLIDEGWSWWENRPGPDGKTTRVTDITRTVKDVDLPAIIEHCRKKGVRVWLWLTWSHCDTQMAEAFPLYEKWGIAGVKVDFMNRDDQWMVNWYYKVAREAAKHHLMVDMHGAYKPTGMNRTWPNMLTQEGVMGLECCKWSADITPEHNVTLPFTRMLAGPMDYTPGGFNCLTPDRFKPRDSAPFVMGTRSHQLAQYVVYFSPLQMCVDYPESYRGAVGFEFLRWVPTVWDESRVIDGYPGKYILMARRRGAEWYVGGMNDGQARALKLPLGFLGSGQWRMDAFTDGERCKEVPEQIRRVRSVVRPTEALDVTMASGGGCAMRFVPEGGAETGNTLIRHLIGLKFKPELTAQQREEIIAASDLLPGQVPEIMTYEGGPNTDRRGLSAGIDYAILLTFRSHRDLQTYRDHPAHRAMAEKYRPWLADMVFVDWEVPQK
ncbi:MAG: glycoside hydrolase family 97 catalytic domain-containing protein [Phycisphaerae bacterium]|nr:glycoside hydrolase family 97 catalytic domain-containing protein [Phycisphaerae bacterium]